MTAAVVWLWAMGSLTLPAAYVAARRVPRAPGPRILAFALVEQVAVLFVAGALVVLFAFPEVVGVTETEFTPLLVFVIVSYAVLSGALLLWLLVPALRGAKRESAEPAAVAAARKETVRRR